jgi:hypothetical protein
MERISQLLILGGVITHTVVLYQTGFKLSLESLNARTGDAHAQCSQFKSLMTLAFIFACVAVAFYALPMFMRYYRGRSKDCKQKDQSVWTKRLIHGSLLSTIYLQAAATFQERTLTTSMCGDFKEGALVLAAGLLTLFGFLGSLKYEQRMQYITIGSIVQHQ